MTVSWKATLIMAALLMDKLQSHLLIFYNYHRDQSTALIKVIRTFKNDFLYYQMPLGEHLKDALDVCIDGLNESCSLVKETVDAIIEGDVSDIITAAHHQVSLDTFDTIILRLEGCYSGLTDYLYQCLEQLDDNYYAFIIGTDNANPFIDMVKHSLVTHRLLFAERLHTISEMVKRMKNERKCL